MTPDPLIGQVLEERYRVERTLGAGGMGCVYRAVHLRTGRPCAVKVLGPEAAADGSAVRRFEREARVLGRLGHPGIVGIHDFAHTAQGQPFLVMDFLDGEDLAARLGHAGALPADTALAMFDAMAAALWAAHQAGVLHRDLKPGNVFLARAPASPERVVLLDFGLAAGDPVETTRLTHTGEVLGTPLYMSPEQARGLTLDARSDVYSLAAILYEMLAGRPPFGGTSFTAVLAAVLTDPPPPLPMELLGRVPPHLDEVLRGALSKDPAQRPTDVVAFATDVLGVRPDWVDPSAVTPRLRAPVPSPMPASPGALGSGLVVAGPSATASASASPPSSHVAAQVGHPLPLSGRRTTLLAGVILGVVGAGMVAAALVWWLGDRGEDPGKAPKPALAETVQGPRRASPMPPPRRGEAAVPGPGFTPMGLPGSMGAGPFGSAVAGLPSETVPLVQKFYQRDFAGCLAVAPKEPKHSRTVQFMAVCALQLRRMDELKRLCKYHLKRFPTDPFNRTCRLSLQGLERVAPVGMRPEPSP